MDLERRLALQAQVASALAADAAELRSPAEALLYEQQARNSFFQEPPSRDVQPYVPEPPDDCIVRRPCTPTCTPLPMVVSFDVPTSVRSSRAESESNDDCLLTPTEKPLPARPRPQLLRAWSAEDLVPGAASPKRERRRSSITELIRSKVWTPAFNKMMPETPATLKEPPSGGKIFADSDAQLESMRLALTEEREDAFACYHEHGICQFVVKNPLFEVFSFVMVCFSSVWIAVEIDMEPTTEVPLVYTFMAQLFCVYFLVELSLQFVAFREKWQGCADRAFIFDSVLVFLIVLETWVLGLVELIAGMEIDSGSGFNGIIVIRILRVLKVLRLGRVLRQLPELLVVVRGIASAFKAISIIVLLLALVIYVAGIFFRVTFEGTDIGRRRFHDVPMAMGTLLVEGTLSGSKGGPMLREAQSESTVFAALLLIYVLLANVTVMGILGGILVRTVANVADLEKAESEFTCVSHALNEVWELWHSEYDFDNDDHMSLSEFRSFMKSTNTIDMLQMHGIDLQSFMDCAPFLFEHHGNRMSKPEFKRCVLDHRGKMAAKVKDHVETRRYLHSFLQKLFQGRLSSEVASELSGRPTKLSELQLLQATDASSSGTLRCKLSDLQTLRSTAAAP